MLAPLTQTGYKEGKKIMKKAIATTCLLGSLIIILMSVKAGDALFMFLMIGLIPGTDIVLSPVAMLEIIALVAGFSVSRLIMPRLVRRAPQRA